VVSMEYPLPPLSHSDNEEEAKDGDEIDDEWWCVCIHDMKIYVEIRCVNLYYAICVYLLNYVMNLKYAMVILLLIYSGIWILLIAHLRVLLFAPVSCAVYCSVWWRCSFGRVARCTLAPPVKDN
jgi:hypothetical protein